MSKHKHSKKSTAKSAAASPSMPKTVQTVSDDERRAMIAEAAYFFSEQRSFQGDAALDDWLRAETEVHARLSSQG